MTKRRYQPNSTNNNDFFNQENYMALVTHRFNFAGLGKHKFLSIKAVTATLMFLLLMSSESSSNAQTYDVAQDPTYTGPIDPCKHVDPFPPIVQKYIYDTVVALKQGKPGPVPTPEGIAIYAKWGEKNFFQDFGGHCRYEAANAALPPASDHRVVFFGDSITELWGAHDPEFFTKDVINRGVSGQTTAQMLLRFRQDVVDLKPETVHIIAGVNDIAGNTGPTSLARIEGNIMSMVEQAQIHHIRVVLGSVLPAAGFNWRPSIKPIPFIREYNAWLKEYAREKQITYIDYFSPLVDENQGFTTKWTADGVHPNYAGYLIMEPLAREALHISH
jgi:lysophospholipase L1-like esterase